MQTANITAKMVEDRGAKIAGDLRAAGLPVMGLDAADMFCAVGITFRLPNGNLMAIRLHYDDARPGLFQAMFSMVQGLTYA